MSGKPLSDEWYGLSFSDAAKSEPARRLVVYVSHAYGGDYANIDLALEWFAWLGLNGFAPMADWMLLGRVWPETRREEGLEIDLEHIRRCDALAQVGVKISSGMQKEADFALKLGMPVVRGPGCAHAEILRLPGMVEDAAEFLKELRAIPFRAVEVRVGSVTP